MLTVKEDGFLLDSVHANWALLDIVDLPETIQKLGLKLVDIRQKPMGL